MEITDSHWTAFRLVEQEGHSLSYFKKLDRAAEKMGIDRQSVSTLLTELKGIAPDLFPIETEKQNMRRQLGGAGGSLVADQPDMVSYDKSLDDGQIKEKY